MKKTIIIVCAVVAIAAVGITCFYAGMQVASEIWMGKLLRETADKVYLLERAKSVVGPTSSDDIEWIDQEIRNADELLSHEEFAELVEKDQIIQRLRNLVTEIRRKRGR